MATQHVGRAAFRYATTVSSTEVEVRLGTPLYDLKPGEAHTRLVTDSIDFTSREVIKIGTPLDELEGTVRAHNNAGELVDLVSAGLDGTKLKYVPDTDVPGTQYHVRLVEAGQISPDQDRAGRGEYQLTMRLRQWSSTANGFDPLYWLGRLLFFYEPGRELSELGGVFASTGSRTYTNSVGVTSATVAANYARDAHYQTIGGEWTRTLKLRASSSAGGGSGEPGETLYFDWPHKPQVMSAYLKWVERGTLGTVSARYLGFGGVNGTSSSFWALYSPSTSAQIGLAHNGSTGGWNATVTINTTHTTGQVAEALFVFNPDALTHTLTLATPGSLKTATGAISSVAGKWSHERAYVNSWLSGDHGNLDVLAIKVASGVRSMSDMRKLLP